jgi:proteasome alpha subunit
MSQPVFYVSPEQQVRDRAEFARAGIAKGRSVIVAKYAGGIAFIGENHSNSLHKVAEIYDRIGFAAVGRYNEFENLRVAGIRHADLRGFAYDRRDVSARMLAGAYAQLLGAIFAAITEKPYEVEMVVAEIGQDHSADRVYRLSFDGSIADEAPFTVIGGAAGVIDQALRQTYDPSASLATCLRGAISALASDPRGTQLGPETLEVAVLDRQRPGTRKFQRLTAEEIMALVKPASRRRNRRAAQPPVSDPQAALDDTTASASDVSA